jgi:hypothetical protein
LEFDDAVFGEPGVACHVAEVGAEFAAVTDRDLDAAGFGRRFVRMRREALSDQHLHLRVGA